MGRNPRETHESVIVSTVSTRCQCTALMKCGSHRLFQTNSCHCSSVVGKNNSWGRESGGFHQWGNSTASVTATGLELLPANIVSALTRRQINSVFQFFGAGASGWFATMKDEINWRLFSHYTAQLSAQFIKMVFLPRHWPTVLWWLEHSLDKLLLGDNH